MRSTKRIAKRRELFEVELYFGSSSLPPFQKNLQNLKSAERNRQSRDKDTSEKAGALPDARTAHLPRDNDLVFKP
jgi:hypothetical protein